MKLKKFNQFINEDFDPENEVGYDSVDDFKRELGEEELGEEDFDHTDDDDDDDAFSTEREEEFADEPEDIVGELGEDGFEDEEGEDDFEEEEEEGHEYKGNLLMRELADMLGTEVVNNQINYNGQKINYYSETEKFHIGREKFETIEEVVDFLKPQTDVAEEAPEVVREEKLEGVGESRKYIKRF
jgi:hypothetical protein